MDDRLRVSGRLALCIHNSLCRTLLTTSMSKHSAADPTLSAASCSGSTNQPRRANRCSRCCALFLSCSLLPAAAVSPRSSSGGSPSSEGVLPCKGSSVTWPSTQSEGHACCSRPFKRCGSSWGASTQTSCAMLLRRLIRPALRPMKVCAFCRKPCRHSIRSRAPADSCNSVLSGIEGGSAVGMLLAPCVCSLLGPVHLHC